MHPIPGRGQDAWGYLQVSHAQDQRFQLTGISEGSRGLDKNWGMAKSKVSEAARPATRILDQRMWLDSLLQTACIVMDKVAKRYTAILAEGFGCKQVHVCMQPARPLHTICS